MAFKLTKDQLATKKRLLEDYSNASTELESAFEDTNNKISEAIDDADAARKKYNNVIEEINAFVDEVANDFRGEFDDKSEGWQGGDKGQEVDSFIGNWEGFGLEKLEDLDDIKLELPELSGDDPFEDLEDEFSG